MYKNLKKKQSPTYSASGEALIKIYQEMTNSGKSETEIIAAMQKPPCQLSPLLIKPRGKRKQQMTHISEEAKQVIIKKALNRGGQTMTDIALANNIGLSTLSRWLKDLKSARRFFDAYVI